MICEHRFINVFESFISDTIASRCTFFTRRDVGMLKLGHEVFICNKVLRTVRGPALLCLPRTPVGRENASARCSHVLSSDSFVDMARLAAWFLSVDVSHACTVCNIAEFWKHEAGDTQNCFHFNFLRRSVLGLKVSPI